DHANADEVHEDAIAVDPHGFRRIAVLDVAQERRLPGAKLSLPPNPPRFEVDVVDDPPLLGRGLDVIVLVVESGDGRLFLSRADCGRDEDVIVPDDEVALALTRNRLLP